MSKINN